MHCPEGLLLWTCHVILGSRPKLIQKIPILQSLNIMNSRWALTHSLYIYVCSFCCGLWCWVIALSKILTAHLSSFSEQLLHSHGISCFYCFRHSCSFLKCKIITPHWTNMQVFCPECLIKKKKVFHEIFVNPSDMCY